MKQLLICDNTKPKDVMDLCRQNGFGIEVQAFYHYNALADAGLIEKTAEMISGVSPVALHGPFGDLNPGSFDPLIREASARRIQEGFNAAARIGATHIVFHDGRVPGAGPAESWIGRSAGFWRGFMEKADPRVHVHLENMLEEGPEILAGIIEQVGSPNLHALLDIGHAHCNSRTPVVEWIEALGKKIGYVHLHDNHGEQDEHLGLGRGTIPMLDVFRALETYAPDAHWAIEAEGDGIGQSLEWLSRHTFI